MTNDKTLTSRASLLRHKNLATSFGLTFSLACAFLPGAAYAANATADPDPDVENGSYLALSLNQDVVAVGDSISGTATVYEGDGDEDSDDNVTASWGGGGASASARTSAASSAAASSASGNGSVNFSFPTSSPGDFTIDAATPDVPDQKKSASAIGGPVTGENDIHYFCDPNEISSWGHLAAAPGQPVGTTYSWSISGKGGQYVPGKSTTSATATYTGVHPGSTVVGDVTATVTYSLDGVSVQSPGFPITVHAPKTFVLVSRTKAQKLVPPDPGAYGFNGQSVTFRITDGLGSPISGANWNEGWYQPNGGGVPGLQGGGALDGNGTNTDTPDQFSYPNYSSTPPNNTVTGDQIFGPLTHVYSVSDEQGTGGNQLGCPVKTYTNIYYYTYTMTGNGFDGTGN